MPRETVFAYEYDSIVTHINATRQQVRIECGSREAARNMRYRFYKYRTALRKSSLPHRQQLGVVADQITATTEGTVCILDHRGNSRDAILLRKALQEHGWTQADHEQFLATEVEPFVAKASSEQSSTKSLPTDPNKFSPEELMPPSGSGESKVLKSLGYKSLSIQDIFDGKKPGQSPEDNSEDKSNDDK